MRKILGDKRREMDESHIARLSKSIMPTKTIQISQRYIQILTSVTAR